MYKILLVEDDSNVSEVVKDSLSREGMEVHMVSNGYQALIEARKAEYDLMILDIVLPGVDGIYICRQLRREGVEIPLLMLSGRKEVEEIVRGIDVGADAYVPKPFSTRELTARVKGLLKRRPVSRPQKLIFGELEIDKRGRSVKYRGREVHLGMREFEMLCLLLENQGRTLRRDFINSRTASRYFDAGESTVDVHISGLRKKLAAAGCVDIIETVYGLGYRIKESGPQL